MAGMSISASFVQGEESDRGPGNKTGLAVRDSWLGRDVKCLMMQ